MLILFSLFCLRLLRDFVVFFDALDNGWSILEKSELILMVVDAPLMLLAVDRWVQTLPPSFSDLEKWLLYLCSIFIGISCWTYLHILPRFLSLT